MPGAEFNGSFESLEAKVKAFDPIIYRTGMRHGLSGVLVETDAERLADGCDALVLVTDWEQFNHLDYEKMAKFMNNPVMINSRDLQQEGFRSGWFPICGD